MTPEALVERLGALDAALADAGRSRSDIKIYVGMGSQPLDADMAAQFS